MLNWILQGCGSGLVIWPLRKKMDPYLYFGPSSKKPDPDSTHDREKNRILPENIPFFSWTFILGIDVMFLLYYIVLYNIYCIILYYTGPTLCRNITIYSESKPFDVFRRFGSFSIIVRKRSFPFLCLTLCGKKYRIIAI